MVQVSPSRGHDRLTAWSKVFFIKQKICELFEQKKKEKKCVESTTKGHCAIKV